MIHPKGKYADAALKHVDEKIEMSNDTKHFFNKLRNITDENEILELIQANTTQIGENLYRKENFIIAPTHFVMAEIVEPTIKDINSLNIKSVPKLIYKFDNNATQKVFVYDIGTNEELHNFDKATLTDRAKTEFYEEIKKMSESKSVDYENIIDTSQWFQNKDGTKIFLLNQNIGGYLTNDKIELLNEVIFNKLFN